MLLVKHLREFNRDNLSWYTAAVCYQQQSMG